MNQSVNLSFTRINEKVEQHIKNKKKESQTQCMKVLN